MRRIETIGTVADDGTLVIPMPSDVAPGLHTVIVEIDERPDTLAHVDATDWSTFLKETAGAWRGDFERPPQEEYEVRDKLL